MLGEAAVTRADAARYLDAYRDAIDVDRRGADAAEASVFARPSISVKLSALHPRYEYRAARARARRARPVRRVARALPHARVQIGMTIDAEEAERLELSLELFARVRRDPASRRLERSRPRRAGLSEARARA